MLTGEDRKLCRGVRHCHEETYYRGVGGRIKMQTLVPRAQPGVGNVSVTGPPATPHGWSTDRPSRAPGTSQVSYGR